MTRLPKINVRHFINKNLKPYWSPYSGYSDQYPLYIQVTFARKNTQIKSHFDNFYPAIEVALNEHKDLLDLERNWIERIIAYEYQTKGKDFNLKGFGQRYPIYSAPIPIIIDQELKKKFTGALIKTKTEFSNLLIPKDQNVSILTYYKAALILTKNKIDQNITLEFKKLIEAGGEYLERYWGKEIQPIVIDWLDSTNRTEYENWLKQKNYDKSKIEKRIQILEDIFNPHIKTIFHYM